MKEYDAKFLIKEVAKNAPWKDFFTGLFIPLTLLQFFIGMKEPMLGVALASGWCLLMVIIDWVKTRKPAMFALITLVMIFLNTAPAFIKVHLNLELYVKTGDNLIFAVIFLVSIFMGKPFILNFVPKEALEKIPEKVRATSYYMKTWNIVSAVWGFSYLLSCIILLYLESIKSPHTHFVDFLFTWPIIMFLLVFSVLFPKLYMMENSDNIKAEIEGKEATKKGDDLPPASEPAES